MVTRLRLVPWFIHTALVGCGDPGLYMKGMCNINDYTSLSKSHGAGVTRYIVPSGYTKLDSCYAFTCYKDTKIVAYSKSEDIACGDFVLYYKDDSSVFFMSMYGFTYLPMFRQGVCSSKEQACNLIRDLIKTPGCGSFGILELYNGRDETVAKRIHSIFISQIDETIYDGGSRDDYTVYRVTFPFSPVARDGRRINIYDSSLAFHQVGNKYDIYYRASDAYDDFFKGTYKDRDKLPYLSYLDFRFGFMDIEGNELYVQHRPNDIRDLSILKYDNKTKKRIVGDGEFIEAFLHRINPVVYARDLDINKEPEDSAENLYLLGIKGYMEKRSNANSESYNEEVSAYNTTNFNILATDWLLDLAQGTFSDDYKAVGTRGFICKAFVFHFSGEVIKVFEYNKTMYLFNWIADRFFKASFVSAYDTYNRKLVLPRIGSGKDIIAHGSKLYASKKRINSLNPSGVYASNHKDTYEICSNTNEFDSSNPAMSELVEIKVEAESHGDDPYETEYTYKVVEHEDEDYEKPYVEAVGRILVSDGLLYARKRVLNDTKVDDVIDLFVTKDDTTVNGTVKQAGIVYTPYHNEYM